MPTTIDNIEIDETNVDFNNALDFVKNTERFIYLTGKAGTGKTTFLKYLKQTTSKNTVVLAPTGVAAINAGGQTIHSFFKISPSVYVPNDLRLRVQAEIKDTDKSTIYDHFKYTKDRIEIIRGMELLIIDEISMVRCDLLDVIDKLLRVFRKRQFEPFGGVQVILIGDTFQLPPIAQFDQWEILNKFYESPFFFSSKVIKKNKPIYIELKKIYRQNEKEFIELLNRVRVNQITQNELTLLNSKLNPIFSPEPTDNYITLATHNRIVDSTNSSKLLELTTELKIFEAKTTGIFPENIMPTNRVLELKEGAQIMFIKNDKQKGFYNGRIAKIESIIDNKIITSYLDNNKLKELLLEKETWNNIKYSWNDEKKKIEEEIIGTFTQFPIKLAWAITVHKSQGLQFEKVIADLGAAFSSGQVYVALSRCTSFNGLVLKTRIDKAAIITDPEVLLFAQNETPSTLIIQELNSGKANLHYKKAREAIKNNSFSVALENFVIAIKYRNDIETETFKRYFISTLSRLSSNNISFLKKSEELLNINNEIIKVKQTNSELQKEKLKQEQKLQEQNNAIKILLDKTSELEKLKETDKQQVFTLTSDLKFAKERLSNKTDELKLLENKIIEQENKAKIYLLEIERLKNLTWLQKLFGK